jgi:ABC-2 type transport system ATP-binding protein
VGHVIELTDLTKVFGRNRAVDGLTCSVEPGVVTGFLGPNGAGKTTTMRMVLGLDRPTSGTATIGGRTYRQLSDPLRTVGALLDANQVHPNRSARDHLRWLAATNRISVSRVDEVLDVVGLESVADKNAGTLSLGMSQRLGIAAALLGDPPVLLFDEPVNGLDPEGIRWVRTLMRALAAEGRTVFVSSHLLAEMANTADRLVVIGRGKLIASTTVAEFVSRSGAEAVRVRSPQLDTLNGLLADAGIDVTSEPDGSALAVRGAAIEVVGELAARNAIVLHELSVRQASLEDAYLRITDADVEYRAAGGDERLREAQKAGDERLREEQTAGDERLREERKGQP